MSEIELNASLTTMELKKSHPSRMVGGGADTECADPIPVWIKIWDRYLRSKESQTQTRPPSARKVSPHNFWL